MNDAIYLPYAGPTVIDFNEVGSYLVDVKENGTTNFRREKKGLAEVLKELDNAVPTVGEAAGISKAVYAQIVEGTGRLVKLRDLRGILEKALEVVEETEALEEHKRENNIAIVVDSVKSTANRKDDSVLGPFQKTLKYHAQLAEKAWKTRRRNEKEKEAAAQAQEVKAAAQAAQSAEPAEPAKPVKPVKPAQPVQSAEPVQSAQPAQPVQSAEPVQPAQPAQPVQPAAEDAHK